MKPSALIRQVICFTAPAALKFFFLLFLVCPTSLAQGLRMDIRVDNRRPRLVWNSMPGGVYHVLSRDSLAGKAWERIATVVSQGDSSEWVDSEVTTSTRFYLLTQGDGALSAQLSIVHPESIPPILLQTITNGTYSAVKTLVQTLAPIGQFRLPLPLPDLDPFPDVLVGNVQIYFDDVNRSIGLWGATTLLDQPVEFLGAAYWGAEGAVPIFSLGIKLSQLTLAMLSETFQASALAGLDFKDTVIILAQHTGEFDSLQVPGKAFAFYEGARIGLERGVNIYKALDLSPLPVLKGLQLLGIPETTLALQGILSGVDPNIFFNGATNLDPALIHLHATFANTPIPGQPRWLATTSRRLDISALGFASGRQAQLTSLQESSDKNAAPLITLTDSYTITLGDDELEFETVTDLSSIPVNGTITVTGTAKSDWSRPFGIEWFSLTNVAIELIYTDGLISDAKLSGDFITTNGIGGVAEIDVPDEADPVAEFTLSVTNELGSAQIAGLLHAQAGLNVTTNDLPATLEIKQPKLVVKSAPARAFSLTGKIAVLGDLETEVLVTVYETNGAPKLVVSMQPAQLKLRHLLPSLTNTFLGEIALPIGGFSAGQEENDVPAAQLDPPAQEFFRRVYGVDQFSVSIRTGVELNAVLPMSVFPASALDALGLNLADRVVLKGVVNLTVGLLTANGPIALDGLRMEADLPLRPLPGLPAALQPVTVLSRKLVLAYEQGALDLRLESTVTATIDGQAVTFALRGSLADTPQGGNVEVIGTMTGNWPSPFGIDWLTLQQAQLRISGSSAARAAALTCRVQIGSKIVEAAVELSPVAGQSSARLRASLDQLTLNDLLSWTQQRFGVSPFPDPIPDSLLNLRDVTVEIESDPAPQLTVSARATVLHGLSANVLFTIVRQDGQNEPVLSLGLDNSSLSGLSPSFAGTTAGDLKFPTTAYTFSRKPLSIPSGNLSAGARAFFQRIHGALDFTFKTEAGVSFAAQLPLSLLPAQAVSILGMNPADTVALEGTVGISFGMLSGSASIELSHLDLKVALPGARPVRLPSWLTADPSVQRTLAFSFQNLPGPENALAIRITDTVGITVDNSRRLFVLSTAVSSTGGLSFSGRMQGSWAQPFGVDWLTLEQVNLDFATDGTTSQGSLSSSFPLGDKDVALKIQVSGGPLGPAVELSGAADQLSIDDLIELVRRQVKRPLFPGTPPADFATLNNVSMTIRLGPTRSFSIGANATLAGQQTELLWSIESTPGQEPHILLGMQPKGWSLGGAFPSLSNPIVDGLSLPTPTLVFANYEKQKEPDELQPEEKSFYGRTLGAGDFSLKIPAGLGLLGGIPVSSLPADGPLRKLMSNLGMPAENLVIEGSLGNSLSLLTGGGGGVDALKDLSLRVVLPPMHPNGSPAWFRSGQLSLRITGAPSIALAGEMTVEVEGDILTFFVESGISFPGPSLQLVGGLEAEGGWTSPFDVEWLTINRLVVLLGIDATGSAKLGFSGDVILGSKDIDVTLLLALSPLGVPTNFILEGASAAGLSLGDIAELQAQIASATLPGAPQVPIDRLPDMAVKNLFLKFAPRPEPALGIERGLAFAGDFYMAVQKDGPLELVAHASFKVGDAEISASGQMISSGIGPITWRDPYLDILLSPREQHLRVGGYAEGQFLKGDLDLALSKEAMDLDLDARILDRWDVRLEGQSEFNFQTPNLPVNGNMLAGFIGDVTSEAKERFSAVSAQGKSAIANAQKNVNEALNVRDLKDLEIGAKLNELLDQLDVAKNAMEAAKTVKDSAYSSMITARRARDAAWNLYVDTSNLQPVLKAARYADYLAKAAVYSTKYAAYQVANNAYQAAQTAYAAIPPIEQNPIIVALRAELADLNQRLDSFRQQLATTTDRFRTIIDAVQQGAIAFESASFDTTLRSLIDTKRVSMKLTFVLLGERRTFAPVWDFNLALRDNLKPVIDEMLREKGIL